MMPNVGKREQLGEDEVAAQLVRLGDNATVEQAIASNGKLPVLTENGMLNASDVAEYLKLKPEKRITATFIPEAWVNDNAIEIDGRREIDVTDKVLALPALEIGNIADRDDTSDFLVDALALGHNGPHSVEVEDSLRDFFNVKSLSSDVTEEMVSAARSARGQIAEGKLLDATLQESQAPRWSAWSDNPFKAIKAAAEARGTPEDYGRALDVLRASAEWENFDLDCYLDDVLQEIAGQTNIVCQY
ncbi:hypothetical protein OIV36_31420, partial [Burkholderia pseudomallei]|uniref:hypothetical protein n=1 Tax=Burkholderia pseudomallei TaxID=28450 RepID=UPI00387B38BB|nr:hypothetical protein [Burkholderia pseudomallei]